MSDRRPRIEDIRVNMAADIAYFYSVLHTVREITKQRLERLQAVKDAHCSECGNYWTHDAMVCPDKGVDKLCQPCACRIGIHVQDISASQTHPHRFQLKPDVQRVFIESGLSPITDPRTPRLECRECKRLWSKDSVVDADNPLLLY